jgi:hypothetical protein
MSFTPLEKTSMFSLELPTLAPKQAHIHPTPTTSHFGVKYSPTLVLFMLAPYLVLTCITTKCLCVHQMFSLDFE